MSQNLVIANKDNLVVYVFGGIDLTLATDIKVQFGGESYTLVTDPLIVIVSSATELSLNLSATAEVGKVFSTVTYFDGTSVLGTDITSRELGNADQIVVAIGTQLQDFKNAQMLASFSINDGVDINAVKDTANLAGFSVGSGAYSESYQSNSSTPTLAQMPAVTKVLKPYTKAGLNGGGLYRENMGFLG